jgi:thiosulfate/3-mercaptopyruvate sulfurtransferase
VPFASLLEEDDKTTFLPPIQIRAKMLKAGIIPGSRVIATCGSGVTACTLAFALALLGQPPELAPVYDGSWADWGRPDLHDLPKMTELRQSPQDD